MTKTLSSIPNMMIGAVLVFQLTGCGTLLYPERKGQRSGRIDVGVALLDGLGLFFFLIPGIIAYVVDFNNGTIYLPGTSMGSLDQDNMKQLRFDPKTTSLASIEEMIKAGSGIAVSFDDPDMKITKLRSAKEMSIQFALHEPLAVDRRIASIQ